MFNLEEGTQISWSFEVFQRMLGSSKATDLGFESLTLKQRILQV